MTQINKFSINDVIGHIIAEYSGETHCHLCSEIHPIVAPNGYCPAYQHYIVFKRCVSDGRILLHGRPESTYTTILTIPPKYIAHILNVVYSGQKEVPKKRPRKHKKSRASR